MPTFQITAPDGKQYEVTGDTAEGAYAALQQHVGGTAASSNPADKQLNDYYSSGIYAGSMNPLGAIARSVDAGATGAQSAALFGFGDEAAGLYGGTEDQRNREKSLAASNPAATLAGQIGGGAMATSALSKAGIIPQLAPGASTLGQVGVGAGTAFGLGSLYGLGTGEDGKRIENAALNGGIGAVAGGTIPLVAKGVSAGYRNLADRFARNSAAEAAGVRPEVAAQLSQTLTADGSLGPQGMANMSRAGSEAMLADAGPNARAVLDTAIQRGGPGAVLARNRIDERVGRAGQALTNTLDNALGQPEGVTAARTAIREGSAAARSSAYDAAYAAPIDYSSQVGQGLENTVRSRVPGSVINEANRLMQLEGNQSNQILARVADDGSVAYERLPDVRQLDYITRALNQAAESGDGAGALGGQTTLGRAYQGLARDIRGNLRDAVPEYATALDTAADPIQRSKAVDLGAKLFSPSLRRDEVSEAVDGYSAAQRDALAQGVRSHIDDTIANVTRTVQDGNTDAREAYKIIRDLSSRANREKLTTALGEERTTGLFDDIDRAATAFELRASVADNSKTFARQSTNQLVENMTDPGIFGNTAQTLGEPLSAPKRIIQALTGQTEGVKRNRQDAIFSEIADYLTRPAQQSIPAFQAMQNYGTQTAANQVRAAEIARLLGQGNKIVYPVGGQASGRQKR